MIGNEEIAVPSGQKKEYADKAGADRTVPVCVKGECICTETGKYVVRHTRKYV